MTDYAAFVACKNRPDLLRDVCGAVSHLWYDFTIIDNSVPGLDKEPGGAIKVFRPPVPLTFTQTMNWLLEETLRREKKFCIYMHNDAIIPKGACEQLLDYARDVDRQGTRWGVIYTHYDVLCVLNPKTYEEIGGYDTNLPWYFSDNDYFYRMDLAGWARIDSNIQVGHGGSQTINSDPYLRHVNGVTFPLYGEYYRAKWGGTPGQETFIHPFGILPREWKLSKLE
jgi:hypothetical protein